MHAADILADVHGVPVAPVCRDHQAFHVGLGMRGLLPDEAPEPEAVERRYRVLERACATAPVYPVDQDPGGTPLPAQVSRSYGEPQSSGAAQ